MSIEYTNERKSADSQTIHHVGLHRARDGIERAVSGPKNAAQLDDAKEKGRARDAAAALPRVSEALRRRNVGVVGGAGGAKGALQTPAMAAGTNATGNTKERHKGETK